MSSNRLAPVIAPGEVVTQEKADQILAFLISQCPPPKGYKLTRITEGQPGIASNTNADGETEVSLGKWVISKDPNCQD